MKIHKDLRIRGALDINVWGTVGDTKVAYCLTETWGVNLLTLKDDMIIQQDWPFFYMEAIDFMLKDITPADEYPYPLISVHASHGSYLRKYDREVAAYTRTSKWVVIKEDVTASVLKRFVDEIPKM